MHPRVIDKRQGEAAARIAAAAASLAQQHGLDASLAAGLAAWDRDPDTRAVLRQEAVADLLEAIAAKAGDMGKGATMYGPTKRAELMEKASRAK